MLLPNLESFIATNNLLDAIPDDYAKLANLDVSNNPLSTIPAAFRTDMTKVCYSYHTLEYSASADAGAQKRNVD